jgi:hypothetical protein
LEGEDEEEEEEEDVKFTAEVCVSKGVARDMSAPLRKFDRAPMHLGDDRYFLQVGNVKLSSKKNKFTMESLVATRKPVPGSRGKPFHFHIPLRLIDQVFNSVGEIMGYNMKTFKADPRTDKY